MAESETAKLTIDGREYEVPGPDDFTLGESVILKRYTDKDLDQLAELKASDPRFLAALVLIVLRREDPSISEEQVANIKLAALSGTDAKEVDARPPDEDVASPVTEVIREVSGVPA